MGKQESERDSSTTRNQQHGSLEKLRDEIESIDDDIVDLIARRTYVAESIAEVKREKNIEINDPERERKVLDRVQTKADSLDIDPDTVAEVFELLIQMNKERQREYDD